MVWKPDLHPRGPGGRFAKKRGSVGQIAKALRTPPSHSDLYHATPERNVDAIHATGFKLGPSAGDNGGFFGHGVYLHTNKAHADESLAGYRAYIDSSMQQIQAQARVTNPFHVHVLPGATDPGQAMRGALADAGVIRRGETPSPGEITRLLQARGHDAVQVHQPRFNHEIAGSQLVVFDPANISTTGGNQQWAQRISGDIGRTHGLGLYDTLGISAPDYHFTNQSAVKVMRRADEMLRGGRSRAEVAKWLTGQAGTLTSEEDNQVSKTRMDSETLRSRVRSGKKLLRDTAAALRKAGA